MKKRFLISLIVVLSLALGMGIGTVAAGGLETISAYLTYNTTVKLDGETQVMYDGNGDRVYPINYKGTTYLPIRAVSNMLGIDVNWDGATKTVLLGKTGETINFIEDLAPYYSQGAWVCRTEDMRPVSIASKEYFSYLQYEIAAEAYYNLEGKYTTLTFDIYSDSNWDTNMLIYGDNDYLIAAIEVENHALPATYTIDVSGVQQLTFKGTTGSYGDYAYIFNATIE